jgi:uncharacterized protein YqeY
MTLLQTRVIEDWKQALKKRDLKKDTLSLIITEFKNRAIKDGISGPDGRTVSDAAALEVLQKMAKQRREAMESYEAAKRPDLVAKENAELDVIASYLPQPLNDDELFILVNTVINDVGAVAMADIGKVMGKALAKADGRADGKRIQAVAQKILSKA